MNNNSVIIARHFKEAAEKYNEFIKWERDENSVNIIYALFHNIQGDEDEYKCGEYLCKIVLTDKFPISPPEFEILTPNGLYDIGGTVCVSIGTYHKDQYPATLRLGGFATQLVSGLIGWKTIGTGIRLIDTTIEQKKKFALQSAEYNAKHHSNIMKLFD